MTAHRPPARFKLCLLMLALLCSGQSLPVNAADEAENATEPAPAAEAEDGSTDSEDSREAPAQPPAKPRVLPDVNRQRHQDVIDFLTLYGRDYEHVRLIAAENEFYGLFMQERSGTPQGAVLILHDNGQHGQWPEIVAPLRENLPQYGWATLSIALPDIPPAARLPRPVYKTETTEETDEAAATEEPPAAEDNATPDNATTTDAADNNGISLQSEADAEEDQNAGGNEPALPRLTALPPLPEPEPEAAAPADVAEENAADKYRDDMLERIRQSVAYLKQRGQHNIVIVAPGSSAGWAAEFMLQRPRTVQSDKTNGDSNDRGYTLVMIDAADNPYEQEPLEQKLAGLDIPVLDLISEESGVPVRISDQRAGMMRHRQRAQYQQIQVPAFALQYDDSNTILRRVRGWLKTHAAGTELPMAKQN